MNYKIEVDRIVTRGQDPGDVLKQAIEEGARGGRRLLQVIALFDEIQLVWELPARPPKEKRAS